MTIPTLSTPDGTTIPAIGFGTYRLGGEEGADSIARAIDAGYRLVDSAFSYENEGAVGAAVRRADVPRDDVIVTSKLPGRHQAHDDAVRTVEESLFRTGLDRIDLYLIHWPNPRVGRYVEAYEALVECRERGLIRHVGVSNFLPEHLDAVIAATGVTPLVNQVELHPYFPQAAQRAADAERGVVTEAWSPVGRASDLLRDPVVTAVAAAHGVSPVQAILRWHVQLGVVPLPKASSPERQRENLDVFSFELTTHEMNALTGLARTDGRTNDQDPAVYEEL
ncbi:diketogulonate reductase-like aldo/keto reductase [Cellulosimicrobium cellulans]|uniref:aldo/keto reductase n=1 Tax=Cellulosimicrobium cellulans TaxID=1710 RepID=UPI00195E517A|nr:aldo/keto reductase [Cellulosimicrobium cellulans]MBM7820943.1 diketogulonate reductase-like aldo/keto reductase [Cellulosimicrobium cellulans]